MRQLRKKTIVILFIAFVISIIIIWYRAPVERSISTSLCSVDGERIDVVFNLSWHKYIFSPTEIRGTIKLYNDTYY
ncbi:MAG TPA: hypothetical protein VJZ06_10125, partial [Mobilitalea sp.]|nr:hypothetical protein [Mobilitalea sp.]